MFFKQLVKRKILFRPPKRDLKKEYTSWKLWHRPSNKYQLERWELSLRVPYQFLRSLCQLLHPTSALSFLFVPTALRFQQLNSTLKPYDIIIKKVVLKTQTIKSSTKDTNYFINIYSRVTKLYMNWYVCSIIYVYSITQKYSIFGLIFCCWKINSESIKCFSITNLHYKFFLQLKNS